MIDTTPLGSFVAEVMEKIGQDFDDTYHIRTISIVVEVDSPERGFMLPRCTDDRPYFHVAFLEEAARVVDDRRHATERGQGE